MLPILLQTHSFILYAYPLLMGLGWGVGYQLFFANSDLRPRDGQILFWGIFLWAWIGSKILFYLTTESLTDQNILLEASFWTGGGFVFYGGLLFGLIFLGLYKLSRRPLTPKALWALLPAITAGHAIGRIGCLLAGCCFGRETDLWWGIELHGAHRHPTQLLEALGLSALLVFILKSPQTLKSFGLYFVGYGLLRFGVECLRGDEIRGHWGAMTPSQWISLVLLSVGIVILFRKQKTQTL